MHQRLNSKQMLYVRQFLFPSFLLLPLLCLSALYLAEQSGKYNLYAWWPLFIYVIILPVVDHILGIDSANHTDDRAKKVEKDRYYRILVLICIPIVLILTVWGAYIFSTVQSLNWGGRIGWLFSIALCNASLVMTAAHELIHKDSRMERLFGSFLLAFACNSGFKIEHIRGHHRLVATPTDTSSAQMDQSYYHFLMRAYKGTYLNSWFMEQQRLSRRGYSALNWRNELIWLHFLTLGFASAFYLVFGILGVIFFIGQSWITLAAQQMANYTQHYGLKRLKLNENQYERFSPAHAWCCNFLLSNMLSFHLPRHTDHHIRPRRRYQVLCHIEESPQMPTGYMGMFLMALIPPLWYRVMNPRILAYGQDSIFELPAENNCTGKDSNRQRVKASCEKH